MNPESDKSFLYTFVKDYFNGDFEVKIMSDTLTMEEIESRFDGEWVLIEDVETDEKLEIVRGKVVYHGDDKEVLHQKAMKSESDHLATLFIGRPDPKIRIEELSAFGKEKTDFLINAHDLPPTASVDGVLGLDFLRRKVLTIDFKQGQIELK